MMVIFYANHTVNTHNAWKARGKQGGTKPTQVSEAAKTFMNTTSLKISETFKNVLCTNLCISEKDLAKIIDSAESKN